MKTGRRTFIKSSLATPIVLTVTPAAAGAQSSNAVCMTRDATRAWAGPGRPQKMVYTDSDDWMRIQINLVELTVWDGKQSTVLPGEYFLGMDKLTYWRLDDNRFGEPSASPTKYTTSSCSARTLGKQRFALVYVDTDGRQTGFAWEKYGGNAVTSSCWASIAARR